MGYDLDYEVSMAVLGVLLGITMCALAVVSLYAWNKSNLFDMELDGLRDLYVESKLRIETLEKRKEFQSDAEEKPKTRVRAVTMGDAIREKEAETANPMRIR